jgi:glutamate synthase domain-containing protein 2
MWLLLVPLKLRYMLLSTALLGFIASAAFAWSYQDQAAMLALPLAFFGAFSVLGLRDYFQSRHAILRNYPITAHLRFLFEKIRPEMRQYFFEDDKNGLPFPRDKRAIVYQRAKGALDKRPFGTEYDVYQSHYEWLHHSLSANAVRALNKGAKMGGFAHDTGEGGFSPYHKENGGDIIWEIGSGYFGCRNPDGTFAPDKFADAATNPQIKMVELKLSQGAKPGHGGVLPAAKVTREIARIRGVPRGQDCVSPARHSAFSTPIELMRFIAEMRRLSGGKPAGFKICIGHPWEFMAIVKAMQETAITPDFIVVDGTEGGTGAAPLEFMDHMGMPLRDGLTFVHSALIGANLRERIKIGAAGKITSGFDMARVMALGADWCNAARGFMFAVGCIQAQQCHTGRCPTGVTSQDRSRQRAVSVADKSQRVANFHQETVKALAELIGAAGLGHPRQLRPHHFMRRVTPDRIVSFAEIYRFPQPGELLSGGGQQRLKEAWDMAQPHTFEAAHVASHAE